MGKGNRRLLVVLVAVLFVAIGVTQSVTDPGYFRIVEQSKKDPEGGAGELMVQLPGQFIVASMAGFREVIAGALWIRADTFFHEGNYEAIIPIVRLVTWFDPRNIDVYTTGAWHLDYNFVDDRTQLSDKRYIPASIALLKEGIRHNPDIWDLYFELGWTHYNKKLMDYEKAREYIELACTKPGRDPNTGRRTDRPEFVDRMLAHAYEKVGRFEDSIDQWHKARKRVEDLIARQKKQGADAFVDESSLDVCDRNLMMLYLRLGWRYGDMESYGKGVEIARRLASRPNPPVLRWAAEGAERDYKARLAAGNPPADALKPLDLGFDLDVKKIAPRVLMVKGKINLVPASEYKDLASEVFTHWYKDNAAADADRKQLWRDGCRVYWRLEDYDYVMPDLETFDWRIDMSKTVQWDSFYVAGGTFGSSADLIDISDPRAAKMYPLASDRYRLTVWVTSQDPGCPDYVQDRVGWKGEAFRDKRYLDKKTMPGFTILRREFVLDRDLNVISD